MNNTTLIRNTVQNNKTKIAFVIGNGINQRFFKGEIPLWSELLKDLVDSFLSNGQDAPDDFSFTELYDLIELSSISDQGIVRELITYLKDNDKREYQDLLNINAVDFGKVLRIVNAPVNNNNQTNNHTTESKPLETFKIMQSKYIKGCRKWCRSNRDDGESLSDAQCVEHCMEMAGNPIKIKMMKNSVKQKVVNTFTQNLRNPDLTVLMNYFHYLDVPILTTNFDTLMSQSLHLSKNKMGESFTDFYPWNVYYSDKLLENPVSGFGIWHINGMIEYPRSIKLGISDYMGNVEKTRKMLHSHDFNEFFNGKNQNNWIGYYTWLHIFFNKNLFFFGLKLDRDEIFLRWLLIQRAKYSQMYNKNLKGWFVDKKIDNRNKFFFKNVGFEVIESEYDGLYNAFV